MPGAKAVSFGNLYSRGAGKKQRPADTPGFAPLPSVTPRDDESTLPPSSSPDTSESAANTPSHEEQASRESGIRPFPPPSGPDSSEPTQPEPTPLEGSTQPEEPTLSEGPTPAADPSTEGPTPEDASPASTPQATPEATPSQERDAGVPSEDPGSAPTEAPPDSKAPASVETSAPVAPVEAPVEAPVAPVEAPVAPVEAPVEAPVAPVEAPANSLDPNIGDITPGLAEDKLRALGVVDPKVPGTNTLPDGRTIVVSQRNSISMTEVSPACRLVLSTPGFANLLEAARASTKNVIKDRSAAALDLLKKDLGALSGDKLSQCDPKTSTELAAALAEIDTWSKAKTSLAAAVSAADRATKAVGLAEQAVFAAKEEAAKASAELLRQQTESSATDSSSAGTIAKLLPSLYKGLKKWESVARGT